MPGDPLAWACLSVLVSPGWFAVRGWYAGRREPAMRPLPDWLPLALAVSVAWSGALMLSGGAAGAVEIVAGDQPALSVGAMLVVLTILWLVPFAGGWVLGGWTRRRCGRWIATITMKSGAKVSGTLQHANDSEIVLADVCVDERRHELLTVSRSDVELFMRSRCDSLASDSSTRQHAKGRRGRRRSRGTRTASTR